MAGTSALLSPIWLWHHQASCSSYAAAGRWPYALITASRDAGVAFGPDSAADRGSSARTASGVKIVQPSQPTSTRARKSQAAQQEPDGIPAPEDRASAFGLDDGDARTGWLMVWDISRPRQVGLLNDPMPSSTRCFAGWPWHFAWAGRSAPRSPAPWRKCLRCVEDSQHRDGHRAQECAPAGQPSPAQPDGQTPSRISSW